MRPKRKCESAREIKKQEQRAREREGEREQRAMGGMGNKKLGNEQGNKDLDSAKFGWCFGSI